MSYRLVVDTQHEIDLEHPLDIDELIQSYSVKILAVGEEEGSEVTAGAASFYLVKLSVAINGGLSALEATDTVDEELHEYGATVFDEETGTLREDLVDEFECLGDNVMFLTAMEILPAHRGRHLGLVVADRLIDLYADGLVVCRPLPAHHDGGGQLIEDEASMAYDRFTPDVAEARKKLRRHWRRIGFEPLDEGDFMAVGTANKRPGISLLRAHDN